MTTQITLPANFGIELLGLQSNNVTLDSADGPVQASAIVLSLNSPVIKEQVLHGEKTILDFQGYSEESVRLFLHACYQGRLDMEKENMAHIHKISHTYQVYWITEAVLNDYRNRVERCAETTYCFETALFLFKEAVSTFLVLKKRTFVDVFIQSFAGVPKIRKKFLKLYLKNLRKYSAEELKIAIELSGGRVDIVVNALANHILEFKKLDDNARGLLTNINFQYLESEHPQAYKATFDVLVGNRQKLEKGDLEMILGLRHGFVIGGTEDEVRSVAWDRNTTLSNLFHTRLPDDPEDEHFEDSQDSLCEAVGSSLALELIKYPLAPTTSRALSSDEGSLQYFSSEEDHVNCEESEELCVKSEESSIIETAKEEDNDDQESEESADSSNADTYDTARFKNRMMKLMRAENVCNLYMFIEDLWDWILTQGNARLDIEFPETIPIMRDIKTHRGWFPISSVFLKRLENSSHNQNVEQFMQAIENTPSLVSDKVNFLIRSREDYCVNSILKGQKEARVAFEFRHKAIKNCLQKGNCGFLFKLNLDSSDDFKMDLGYSKSDYENRSTHDRLNLDFHDNLMFAQRMHVTLTGFKGTDWSLPLSWEGKPVFDEDKNMVSWGRHKFLVNTSSGAASSVGEEIGNSSDSPKTDTTSSGRTTLETDSNRVYNWRDRDEPRFEVYYCTA